jgi:hypothetical protein
MAVARAVILVPAESHRSNLHLEKKKANLLPDTSSSFQSLERLVSLERDHLLDILSTWTDSLLGQ